MHVASPGGGTVTPRENAATSTIIEETALVAQAGHNANLHGAGESGPAPHSGALRLSVVIPSFNQAAFIEQTLESLFNQQDIARNELEIVVIDGGSSDGSVGILERHSDRIAYWVSEPDEGQTHALIKGFEVATGDVLGWLCSDDLLEPRAARQVLDFFASHPKASFVYGDACWIDRDSRFLRWNKEIPFNWFIWVYDYNYIAQPSAFWRRGLYEEVGGLRQEFDLAMDADLWARFARITRPRHVRRAWSKMRSYPEQKNKRLRTQSDAEDLRIRRELGYRVDWPVYRSVMYVLAKAARVCWKLVTRCYW